MSIRLALAATLSVTALVGGSLASPVGASPVGGPAVGAAVTGPPDMDDLCARLRTVAAKAPLCTHGPDPVDRLGGRAALSAPPPAAAPGDVAQMCSDDGVSGRRIEVLYGVPRDRTNRYDQMLPTMRNVLAQVDDNLDRSHHGTTQHYRFLCENGSDVTIRNVILLPVGDDTRFTFSDYTSSLQRQVEHGLGPRNYVGDRVYITFVDQITGVYPYGGQGSIYSDDRPDPAVNYNNAAWAKYSMTAYFSAHVVAHEIGHNIGAVQNSAPHASGGYHCHDDYDLMCYSDGGSYFQNGGQLTYPCAGGSDLVMDCGKDDYYHPGTPAPSSYLATHWNTAISSYLTPAEHDADPCSVRGTSGDDVLSGTSGEDVICGLGGDDILRGQGGSDTLVGGAGEDKVDFADATTAVAASLLTGSAEGQGSDTLEEIESIDGSAFADVIEGDDAANVLAGKGGDDSLAAKGGDDAVYGGEGVDTFFTGDGDDRAVGGTGIDRIRFGVPVSVSLVAGTASGQGSDTLLTIEDVSGSPGADTLRGSAVANLIEGGGGDDRLLGEGGRDKLHGLGGRDALTGGPGTDLCDGGIGTDTGRGCERKVAIP